MATNHTANYQLNQWEPTDQVLRTDFNADNSKIDAALKSLSTTVQQHTTQLTQQASQLAARGNVTYEAITYVGTGLGQTSSLTFEKKPLMLEIRGETEATMLSFLYGETYTIGYCQGGTNGIRITWSGNSVSWVTTSNNVAAQCNTKGETYLVLALLDAGT